MLDHQRVPEWVRVWHDRLVDVLCLLERTRVEMRPIDQETEAQGQSRIDYNLRRTVIQLPYDIQPDKDGYETVAHEVLHATQGGLFAAKDQLLLLVPRGKRKAAARIWLDALEQWTERTSWGLTRTLSPLYARSETERNETTTTPRRLNAMAKVNLDKMTKAQLEDRYASLLEQRDQIRDDIGETKAALDRILTMERTASILGVKPEDLDPEDWDALAKVAAKAGPPPGSVAADVNLLQSDAAVQSTDK